MELCRYNRSNNVDRAQFLRPVELSVRQDRRKTGQSCLIFTRRGKCG